ncbi:MAG: DUF362 domain-containing protein [Armatimonadota bacterium]|nr:DUF362 domain-containing protein [bacterium]
MSPIPEVQKERATVGIVKVNDKKMRQGSVDKAVKDAVGLLGGIGAFVKNGQIVAIKPNQTLFKLDTDGSTTSPRMVISLIKMCKDAGAKEVWVVESAGHAQSTRRVMSITGMATAIKDMGAFMIYLDEVSHTVVDFGEDAPVRYMPVAEALERVDVFIDCPKAKTHFVDPISGACKNWVGLMPMSFRLHTQKDVDPYYQGNAELLKRYRPALTVFDGMVAGEGQGPGSNDAFWWGYIIASDDPVAADVTVTKLFSLDWQHIRMAKEAEKMGVGIYDLARTDIKGVPLAEATVQVKPADPGVHRYPCNVIVGSGSGGIIEGTLGHWKTIADAWLKAGLWDLFTSKGTPTFMFGEAEDPLFEKHLREGPYIVLDDSAKDKYKYDPRVKFVPGNPVPQSYMQHEMVESLGFGSLYEPGLRMYEMATTMRGKLTGEAGKPAQASTLLKSLAATAAVAAAAVPVISYLGAHREEVEIEEEEEITPSL